LPRQPRTTPPDLVDDKPQAGDERKGELVLSLGAGRAAGYGPLPSARAGIRVRVRSPNPISESDLRIRSGAPSLSPGARDLMRSPPRSRSLPPPRSLRRSSES
jgi:hypothetical protein